MNNSTEWPEFETIFYNLKTSGNLSNDSNLRIALRRALVDGFRSLINNIPRVPDADGDPDDYIDIGGPPDYNAGILIRRSAIIKFCDDFDENLSSCGR